MCWCLSPDYAFVVGRAELSGTDAGLEMVVIQLKQTLNSGVEHLLLSYGLLKIKVLPFARLDRPTATTVPPLPPTVFYETCVRTPQQECEHIWWMQAYLHHHL